MIDFLSPVIGTSASPTESRWPELGVKDTAAGRLWIRHAHP